MKKKFLCGLAFLSGMFSAAFSQQAGFSVQGHPRPDLEQKSDLKETVAKAEAKADEATFSFADINFWVGEGTNQAALVIDWHDESLDHALVWGFRWNGEATGYDMVAAVAAADYRLTLLTHSTNLGQTVAAFAFNPRFPRATTLTYAPADGSEATTHTPENGIVTTDAYNYDYWSCTDETVYWKSGWYTKGYWSYQVKDGVADEFTYSGLGASKRKLTNGCVDGWSFAPMEESTGGTLPRMPYEAVLPPVEPTTDADAYWGMTGKDISHQTVTDMPVAISADNLSLKWSFAISTIQPIVAGDYVYCISSDKEGYKVHKLSVADGSIAASSEPLNPTPCSDASLAYGDGKIFVALNNRKIKAFNAVTLEPLYVAECPENTISTYNTGPLVYHDGYLYGGDWGMPGNGGVYYCFSTEDEDPSQSDEIKSAKWSTPSYGFRYILGTIVGDYIYVGRGVGANTIARIDRKTGAFAASANHGFSLSLGEGVSIWGGSSYDAKTERLFFKDQNYKIYSVKISDGLDPDSKCEYEMEGEYRDVSNNASAPVVYNGRVYVTGGSYLDVLDAETLTLIYRYDLGTYTTEGGRTMGKKTVTQPLISTAFATAENNYKVYIYITLTNPSEEGGDIICLEDYTGNTTAKFVYQKAAPVRQIWAYYLFADQYGTIYTYNYSDNLWAFESRFDAEGIHTDLSAVELEIGQKQLLKAEVEPLFATNRNVFWRSSDEGIATVDASGTVRAIAVGEATITARSEDGGFEAEVKVTVKPTPVSGVMLSQTSVSLDEGATVHLVATVTPAIAFNKNVTWSSSAPETATVNDTGLVSAVAAGEAVITVTTEDGHHTAECRVTVKATEPVNPTVPVTGITLDRTTAELEVGRTLMLNATVLPENATNKNVLWTSDYPSIATVGESGLVTAVAEGSAVIRVSTIDGNKTAVCVVTVKEKDPDNPTVAVTGVTLDQTTAELTVGDEPLQLTATVLPADATNKDLMWTSSATAVATVSETGMVTALSAGTTVVKVTTEDGGFTAECRITVKEAEIPAVPVSGISIDPQEAELTVGDEPLQLTATVLPADATNKNVKWTCSAPEVASVSESGMVTALSAGSALITATTEDGNHTAVCRLKVAETVANETDLQDLFTVYPNPTGGILNVNLSRPAVLDILASDGRLLSRKEACAGLQQVTLEKSGVYYIRITAGNRTEVKRVVRR